MRRGKKTEIISGIWFLSQNNMLTNKGGTLCVPDPSHLIRFTQMQCCTVHCIQVTSCMEDIEEQSKVIVMLVRDDRLDDFG